MARLEEAHYTREITHPSNWLKPSSQSLESNENAENAPKKKSMDRISRLFQKKPKKKTQAHPISLTSSFSSLSLASSELSPVSDVHPMMESQHMRRGLSGMASGSLLQPIESTESHSSTSNLLKGEGIKPESGTIDTTTDPLLFNTTSSSTASHLSLAEPTAPKPAAPKPTASTSSDLLRTYSKQSLQPPQAIPSESTHLKPTHPSPGPGPGTRRPSNATLSEPNGSLAALRTHLTKQCQVLENLELEKLQYQQESQELTEHIRKLQLKRDQRDTDMSQLKMNYDKHLCSMRATSDDVDSIATKLRLLKENIVHLTNELVTYADPVIATQALCTFWLNLADSIHALKGPDRLLPPHRIHMLTEKFIMDVLVQNLNSNVFPGLSHEATEAYQELCTFFELHDKAFSIRLRQELALVVVEKKGQNNTIDKALHDTLQSNWKYLYGGLSKAFPFLYQHDKSEPDVRKHYGAKIQKLVEQTVSLGCAIKGQEIAITGTDVREGEQAFDGELMVDVDHQTSGVVVFCICPPFVTLSDPYGCLEMGKVLCRPHTS